MRFMLFILLALCTTTIAGENPVNQRTSQLVKSKIPYPLADDYTFLRRLWYDAAGIPPDNVVLNRFLHDTSADKRAKAVEEVLSSQAFNYRWTFFFEEMFKTQIIDDPNARYRNQFHKLVEDRISKDAGLDDLARRILTYEGALVGEGSSYMYWVTDVLDVEFRLDRLDDQMAFITDTFLGVQTRCISCHNGKYHLEGINEDLVTRKRADFWGMAAFLASTAVYLPEENFDAAGEESTDFAQLLYLIDVDAADYVPDRGYILDEEQVGGFQNGQYVASTQGGEGMRPGRAGGVVQPVYMFTGETPKPGETRRQALARMITADRQFARNMVNRIWAHYFGEGFVNPVNGFDLARLDADHAAAVNTKPQPYDTEMMEMMTDLFIQNNYQLKPLMRAILNSELYQLDYENLPDPGTGKIWPYWGGNRRVRRLEAESIVDSLYTVAGVNPGMLVTGLLGEGLKTSTWQLPGTFEPNPFVLYAPTEDGFSDPTQYGYATVEDYQDAQFRTWDLLFLFGRGTRDLFPRNHDTNIQTALGMMNNINANWMVFDGFDRDDAYINQLIDQHESGQKTTDQVVDELYLRVLIRPPNGDERAASIGYIGDDAERIRDLMWALVNLPEFLYR